MKKSVRVLGWRVAKLIDSEKLARMSGRGESWYATGSIDMWGRGEDVTPLDSVNGPDTYHPRPY